LLAEFDGAGTEGKAYHMEDKPEEQPLPQPEVSGSDLAQEHAVEPEPQVLPVVHAGGGIAVLELSEALRGIAEVRSQAGMLFLVSHVARLEREISELHTERDDAKRQEARYRELHGEGKQAVAVLRERLKSVRDSINLRSSLITVGSVALGIAVPPLLTQVTAPLGVLALVGAVVLLTGWSRSTNGEGQ
jgi:hypothetical protein